MSRAIADQGRTIRIPVHMVETINKLLRVTRLLVQRLGREPSPEEIAEQMEMPLDKVQKALNIVKELRLRRSRPCGPFLEQRRCRVCNVGRCSSAEIKHALAQHTYLNRVREDFMSGVRSGVNGTPTLFINGLRHDGSYDRDNLLAAIADVVR